MTFPVWLIDLGFAWPPIAFIGGLLIWLIRREAKTWRMEIIAEVKASTKQIQPGANGGKSLDDAHKKLDALTSAQAAMGVAQDEMGMAQAAMDRRLDDHLADGHGA